MNCAVILIGWFFFISFVQYKGENVRICEDQSKEISCNEKQKLSIEAVTQTEIIGAICERHTIENCKTNSSYILTKCNGKQNCTIAGNELKPGICNWYSRYISVKYTCHKTIFGHKFNTNKYNNGICSSETIGRCYFWSWISSIEVITESTIIYPQCEVDWVKREQSLQTRLTKRCKGRYNCGNRVVFDDKSFYLPFSVDIIYRCLNDSLFFDNDTRLNWGNEPSLPANVAFANRTSTNTKTPDYNKDDSEIIIFLDEEMRILAFNREANKTYSLCANLWSDSEASVACRHFNISNSGKARNTSRNGYYSRVAFTVKCLGNESSLFNCDQVNITIRSVKQCQTEGDATVKCLGIESNVDSDDMQTNDIKESPKTGAVVGIVIGCLLLFLVVILILWYKRHEKIYSNKNMREQRVICDTSRGHDNACVNTDAKEEIAHAQNNPSNQDGYNRREGANQSTTNPSGSEDHYSSSTEGVYDVTNKNWHVIKDNMNIYSHTVDDVYDVSGKNRKQNNDSDDSYQQFTLQENEYNSLNAL